MNLCSSMGNTPLFFACMHGHVDCVRILLKLGADPHQCSEYTELRPIDIATEMKCDEVVTGASLISLHDPYQQGIDC